MPRNRQRYILDIDDLLRPEFMTSCNANSLVSGLNASGGNVPLATSMGGTGVIGPVTFEDAKLLRYNATIKKIVTTILSRDDLDEVAAGGDLTGYYPDPSIAPNAVTYPKIGTDNAVTDILNAQTVQEILIQTGGAGYSGNTYAVIDPPQAFGGIQATVSLLIGSGVVTGTTSLVGGSGYTSVPDITVIDPGPGGGGLALSGLTLTGGSSGGLVSFAIANGGTGYIGTLTGTVPTTASTPTLTVAETAGVITGFTVTSAGSGFNTTTLRPSLSIQNGGSGTGAWIVAQAKSGQLTTTSGGTYYNLKVGGAGYSANTSVTINPPPGGGTQATATLVIAAGVITGMTVNNPGAGYTGYFTLTITDPGASGTGAALSADVLELPTTNGAVILGATQSGDGSYALEWFAPVDLSFLDGQISPVTIFDVISAGYQYYTVPANATSLQLQIFGAGGVGGVGAAGSGTQDGGGGGGGSYIDISLTNLPGLNVLDGQGQIKIYVGNDASSSTKATVVQFAVGSAIYTLTAGGGVNGQPGNGGQPVNPAGGAGGVPLYQNTPITSGGMIDGNLTINTYGSGGPGFEGAGQDGVLDTAVNTYFGNGGTNGAIYLTANPSAKNGPSNPRYQNNSSKSDANVGGNGTTPGNGGGAGRNGNAGGTGGRGQVIVTVGLNEGSSKYLLVPKVLGLFKWDGTAASLVFGSNISGFQFNNTASGVTNTVPNTSVTPLPAYTLYVQMIKGFSTTAYSLQSSYSIVSGDTPPTHNSIIVSVNEFYVTFSGALPGSSGPRFINFTAYGTQ